MSGDHKMEYIEKNFISYKDAVSNKNLTEIKELLTNKVSELNIDQELKDKITYNINNHLSNETELTEEEKSVFSNALVILDILKVLTSNAAEKSSEIIKGGHVMIEDDGELYKFLEDFSESRISSHHKENKEKDDKSFQAGEIFREFLFGQTKEGKTWLQLEAHSTGGIYNLLAHLIDYITYKITGKNVGQYGISDNLDSNPITIDKNITTPKDWREKLQIIKKRIILKL